MSIFSQKLVVYNQNFFFSKKISYALISSWWIKVHILYWTLDRVFHFHIVTLNKNLFHIIWHMFRALKHEVCKTHIDLNTSIITVTLLLIGLYLMSLWIPFDVSIKYKKHQNLFYILFLVFIKKSRSYMAEKTITNSNVCF